MPHFPLESLSKDNFEFASLEAGPTQSTTGDSDSWLGIIEDEGKLEAPSSSVHEHEDDHPTPPIPPKISPFIRVESPTDNPDDYAAEVEADSFDFTVAPADNANDVPVDLELVLLNDVSGNVADTKYDLSAADHATADGGSSISFEVHCVRVITQNDAVGEMRYDEFATYTNSTSDTAQSDWIAFG